MRGSPDIPEIHPLPTPHFLHMVQNPVVSGPLERGISSLFSAALHPPPVPREPPRVRACSAAAGKQCVQDDITGSRPL